MTGCSYVDVVYHISTHYSCYMYTGATPYAQQHGNHKHVQTW